MPTSHGGNGASSFTGPNTSTPPFTHTPSPSSTSTVPLGSTLSFFTDSLDVTLTRFVQITTSTVVSSRAATVYGIPVNGYNIVGRGRSDSTETTETAAGSTATTPADGAAAENNKISGGVIAGAAIGGVAGLVLLGLALWFIRRWRIKKKAVGSLPMVSELPEKDLQQHEMLDQNLLHEMPGQEKRHELASHNPTRVHELPSQNPRQMYELPGYQPAEESEKGDDEAT